MYSLPTFLKLLREKAELTQEDLATSLGVSTVLISMIESGQKGASKKFLNLLAEKLKVHPKSLAPFAFNEEITNDISPLEKKLMNIGSKLQDELISDRVKYLKNDKK